VLARAVVIVAVAKTSIPKTQHTAVAAALVLVLRSECGRTVDMTIKHTNDAAIRRFDSLERFAYTLRQQLALRTRKIAHAVLSSTYTQHELERHIFFAIRESMGTGLASNNGL